MRYNMTIKCTLKTSVSEYVEQSVMTVVLWFCLDWLSLAMSSEISQYTII